MKKAKGGFLTIALFAVAATLLCFSVVSGSRAALTYYSDVYAAEVSMQAIGVSLVENDQIVSYRDFNESLNYEDERQNWSQQTGALVAHMLDGEADGQLKLGKTYDEVLTVRNTGTIDEYVRVSIYKYWADADADGTKRTDLDPDLIQLPLVNTDKWIEQTGDGTEERTVLFYNGILGAGAETEPFADKLTIDAMGVEAAVTTTTQEGSGGTVIETTYDYNGLQFVLEVHVDAVQTHNAAQAMRSAWGKSYIGG